MRPFRFFFAVSLGIVLFFFLARFVIVALIGAAILSLIFYWGRRIKRFFHRLSWEDEDYFDYRTPRQLPKWKDDLLLHYPNKEREYLTEYRTIKVH